ncbi:MULTISPECIES: response regulator [Myxococcus]|uniref:response regulator n=1 Tax=Myxococcus TaxID=32 RepID=UPI0003037B61|nr:MULTISPECIES: response regulator [Myxococcus]QZZ51938.1 Sporulation initiation phosphotransferase F [Myxococcus xanthus]UYI11675.1 response regulator [Myxococcus xanthus]UYI19044.1 response regulator [Myxococcus xanthus]SDW77556.1 Response regulator receiver domain-containing protein [Myxococcus xanthus]
MAQNILIVDDESSLCWVLGQFFSGAGYRVDSAGALDEALDLMTTGRYDLVISDLRLSGTLSEEGLMLADFVRRYTPQTRVVLLTAFATQELTDRAQALGVDLVLSKPQPLPTLAEHVSRLLAAAAV